MTTAANGIIYLLSLLSQALNPFSQLPCVLRDWWCRVSWGICLGSHELCKLLQTGQSLCHLWHQPSWAEWPYHASTWLWYLQEENRSFWVSGSVYLAVVALVILSFHHQYWFVLLENYTAIFCMALKRRQSC